MSDVVYMDKREKRLARMRLYSKEYNRNHKEQISQRNKAYASKNKDKINARLRETAVARWDKIKNNPEKHQKHLARHYLNRAINSGKIIKPENCQLCNDATKLYGHHYLGYAKEHQLHVQWLCIKCHNEIDLSLKEN